MAGQPGRTVVVVVDAATVVVVVVVAGAVVVVVVDAGTVVVVDVVVTTTNFCETLTVAAKMKASSNRPPTYGFPLLTEPKSAWRTISEKVPEKRTDPQPAEAVAPYPLLVVLQFDVGFLEINSMRLEPTKRKFFWPSTVIVTPGFITWNSVHVVDRPFVAESNPPPPRPEKWRIGSVAAGENEILN